MPQLLSLVGKALGSIIRASGSNDSSGRNRSSVDSDTGFDGSKRTRASAAGAPPASEPPSRQRSSVQDSSSGKSGGPSLQSADLLGASRKSVRTAGGSGCTPAAARVGAAVTAEAVGMALAHCATVGVSAVDSSSPQAVPHFFRASRASLSDATASAAGEALRQASVTTCKHFSRENYNHYVRWVRATRGAMKLAGKIRTRAEASCRNPGETLLLRCEHWLEVTDEQHRYGSNLRLYFDFWVAELEAAELTPPASPALMSPSPSCSHLVALAQQQQQQQQQQHLQLAANAIAANAAVLAERTSPNNPSGWPGHLQQQRSQLQQDPQQAMAAAMCAGHGAGAGAGASQSPGPGPSRFSSDANAVSRCGGSPEPCGAHQQQQLVDEQGQQEEPQQRHELLQPQSQRNGQDKHQHHHRVHHHYQHNFHLQNHNQFQNHNQHHQANSIAAAAYARGKPEAVDGAVTRPAADSAPGANLPMAGSQGQEQDFDEQQQPQQRLHQHQRRYPSQQNTIDHQHHDLLLYDRDGNVHRCTDDGGGDGGGDPDSRRGSFSMTRSQDGVGEEGRRPNGGELLSPPDAAEAVSGARPARHSVRFITGSCDPQPTLLQRRLINQQVMQQQELQRRRSCGESEVPPPRHPAAAQPRPSSDAVPVTVAPEPISTAATTGAQQQQQGTMYPQSGSPRRSVLCSPSRRFMLAAMIDMSDRSDVAQGQGQGQQKEQLQGQGRQQQQQQQALEARGQGVAAQDGMLGQQLLAAAVTDAAAAAAAAPQGGCAGAPPETPTPLLPHQHQGEAAAAAASLPPVTPVQNGVGGAAAESCTVQRAAKLMSNRASVGSGTSFFRWLDNGPGLDVDLTHLGVPRAKLDAERVKYLTSDELLEYELDVDIETGLLRYKRSGKLLHTGPDGRGSLDEHRRPPTPPPPAVPLALLGKGAAAWWKGSGATEQQQQLPQPPASTSVLAPSFSAGFGAAAAVPRRPSFRRAPAMSTVPEGASGGGARTPPRQQLFLADDAVIEAAAAAAAAAIATPSSSSSCMLPDLEIRGHSASSLARLQPSAADCFQAKHHGFGDSTVVPGGGGDSGGDSGSCSQPGLSLGTGLAAPNAPTAAVAAALNVSVSEASRGGSSSNLAATLSAAVEEGGGAGAGQLAAGCGEDTSAPAITAKRAGAMLRNQTEHAAVAAALQLPGAVGAALTSGSHWMGVSVVPSECMRVRFPNAAIGDGADAAVGSAPRTPDVAAPSAGGGGAGGAGASNGHGHSHQHHHEEKVAKWIYVVDPQLRLYVHPKVRGRFHHSSFLCGGAVVAAGGLMARHGRLRLLTGDSGHYWPREENFRWLCEHLVSVGADLSACDLRSKHMAVPAATGRELMEKMGVPPPWRLAYHTSGGAGMPSPSELTGPAGLSGPAGAAEAGTEMGTPPSPLAEHMHLLQLQEAEEGGNSGVGSGSRSGGDAEVGVAVGF